MKQIEVNNIGTWYYITEDGRCYNSKTNNWLNGQINSKTGYLTYYITLPKGQKKRIAAHRAVAIAYINNPKGLPQINHKDGNKLNNHIDNLEWVTQEENQQHAINTELRKYNHIFCFSKDKELVAEYKNVTEASIAVGVSKNMIFQEIRKEEKALVGGFYWSKEKTLYKVITYSNNGKAKKVNQYDLKGKFITSYPSTGIAAKAIHGNHSHIGECCRGKIKSYKGYIWRYSDDIVSPSLKEEENTSKVL